MGDFYGTGVEIWAGSRPIGSNEKKPRFWAVYEQLLRCFFMFSGAVFSKTL